LGVSRACFNGLAVLLHSFEKYKNQIDQLTYLTTGYYNTLAFSADRKQAIFCLPTQVKDNALLQLHV